MNEIKIIKQISCSLLLTAGSNEQNHDIPDLLDQYLPVESIPEFSLGSEIYNLGSAYIVPNNQRESHRDRDKSGKW